MRRCVQFARDWGYGALCLANLFAFRHTSPAAMKAHPEPVGPDNDAVLVELASEAGVVVAAWGAHGGHLDRQAAVLGLIPRVQCLSRTKAGFPGHTLYLRKTLTPVAFVP